MSSLKTKKNDMIVCKGRLTEDLQNKHWINYKQGGGVQDGRERDEEARIGDSLSIKEYNDDYGDEQFTFSAKTVARIAECRHHCLRIVSSKKLSRATTCFKIHVG
jgi:hypothetical protein